jgi:hypothetical protein
MGTSENPNSKEGSTMNYVLDPFVMGHNLVGSSLVKEKEMNDGDVAQLQKVPRYYDNFSDGDNDTCGSSLEGRADPYQKVSPPSSCFL